MPLFVLIICLQKGYGQTIAFLSGLQNKMRFSIINPKDEELTNYSKLNNVLFFSVLQYNSKSIDVQVIPKRVNNQNYEFIDLTHFIKKENFSIEDQVKMFTKYKSNIGSTSDGKYIILILKNENNNIHFTDDKLMDSSEEYNSYFSIGEGRMPKFLKQITIKCEFTNEASSDTLNSQTKKIFPNGFHLSKISVGSCKTENCEFIHGDRATYFTLLIHNENEKIADASTLDRGPFPFEFNPEEKIEAPFSSLQFLPLSEFSDKEKLELITENRCSYENSYWMYLYFKWNSLKKQQILFACQKEMPSFITREIIKLSF